MVFSALFLRLEANLVTKLCDNFVNKSKRTHSQFLNKFTFLENLLKEGSSIKDIAVWGRVQGLFDVRNNMRWGRWLQTCPKLHQVICERPPKVCLL